MEQKLKLSDYLKIESFKAHESIEKSFDLLSLVTHKEVYTAVLKAFYSYYRQVEEFLKNFTEDFSVIGLDINARLKLQLLAEDLLHYGWTNLEDLPLLEETKLPEVNNILQAMGVFYVLEGSTLGGQVISSHLKRSNLLGPNGEGGRFLSGYGDKTHEMWTTFKFALNSFSGHNDNIVLNSVRETFRTLEAWLIESRTNAR